MKKKDIGILFVVFFLVLIMILSATTAGREDRKKEIKIEKIKK
jgi:hypothetical protein